MRVLFAGGGTAGHINPAVSVANLIKEKEPDSEFLFVGTKNGMESTLVPKNGYDIRFIEIHGFRRSLSPENIKTVCEIFTGIRAAGKIIKEFKPDVVMGTGGYVTGPVLFAAAMLKIPTIVHESNAYPGVTIRILSRFVSGVALGMKEAAEYLPRGTEYIVTGNPIRPSILRTEKSAARKALGLDSRPVILIFGGSLGAGAINRTAAEWIAETAEEKKYQVLMSTGRNNQYEYVMGLFKEKGVRLENCPDIKVSEYIYDMELALNAADLIVARSGSSVSEMTALGKPAILIPSPNVAGNHQEHNARAVEKSGGAIVITEDKLSEKSLGEAIASVVENPEALKRMQCGAMKIGICDAADKIYAIMKEMIPER